MWDLSPMSIFINHPLYVSYSSLSNMGLGCYMDILKLYFVQVYKNDNHVIKLGYQWKDIVKKVTVY